MISIADRPQNLKVCAIVLLSMSCQLVLDCGQLVANKALSHETNKLKANKNQPFDRGWRVLLKDRITFWS